MMNKMIKTESLPMDPRINSIYTQVEKLLLKNQIDYNLSKNTDPIDEIIKGLDKLENTPKHGTLLSDKEYLDNILNSMFNTIIVVKPDGTIESVNRALLNQLGYLEEEVINKRVDTLINFEKKSNDSWVKTILTEGFINHTTKEYYRKDGISVPVLFSASPMLDNDNNITGIVCAGQDMTEIQIARKTREKLLAQLETTNDELKDFAYIVSHDLRAPLRAISTLAQWLVTDYHDKLDEEGQEQLNLLINRAKRMEALIDGVLRYSRVNRERQEISETDLNEIVSNVIDLINCPENITIELSDTLPIINIDKTRISQVFQNLIGNAIKYMDKKRGIIQIGFLNEKEAFKFFVKDNGPGINKNYFDKIFQIFQTLNPRDEIESTGIGLSIVKKIIELYNGKLWIESIPGEGSTFYFTLPENIKKK